MFKPLKRTNYFQLQGPRTAPAGSCTLCLAPWWKSVQQEPDSVTAVMAVLEMRLPFV